MILNAIEILHLSERPYNALIKAGINTISELNSLTPLQLLQIQGLGRAGLQDLEIKLNKYNQYHGELH